MVDFETRIVRMVFDELFEKLSQVVSGDDKLRCAVADASTVVCDVLKECSMVAADAGMPALSTIYNRLSARLALAAMANLCDER